MLPLGEWGEGYMGLFVPFHDFVLVSECFQIKSFKKNDILRIKGNLCKTYGCVCVSHSIVPDSSPPHGLQPTRLLCPWNSPGKNTGVGCHFLLQNKWIKMNNY